MVSARQLNIHISKAENANTLLESTFTNSVILFNWDYTITLNLQARVEQKVKNTHINSYKTIKNTSSKN